MSEYDNDEMDNRNSSVWRLLYHSLHDMMDVEHMKNLMQDVWKNAGYEPVVNSTFEAIQEVYSDLYGEWKELNFEETIHSLNFGSFCTMNFGIFLFLGVFILSGLSAWTTKLTSTESDITPIRTSPAKVLSIFEMAKTAYIRGHTEEVIRLVDILKFDVNFPIPTTGMSLLLCACISGEKSLVEFLLQRGGDARSINCDGDSCLYLATFATRHDVDDSLIEVLLKHGCNVNGQNFRGNTALHLAATRGNLRLAQTLLSYGADPQKANHAGVSPMYCAFNAGHMETAELLKKVSST